MTTSELVTFLKTQEFTDEQAYNLLVADLYQFVELEEVERSQKLVQYMLYKIQSICFQAIRELKHPMQVVVDSKMGTMTIDETGLVAPIVDP